MGVFRREQQLKNYRVPADVAPLCPRCDEVLDGLMSMRISATAGDAQAWLCPHCHVILGVGHPRSMIDL